MSRVLVTGGAGYIGSHTCIELMAAGHQVVVVDNLCNSKRESLTRVERIAGQALQAFVLADIRDRAAMRAVFAAHDIDAVIHFAGLKAVGESVAKPLEYYDNNVSGTVALCEVDRRACRERGSRGTLQSPRGAGCLSAYGVSRLVAGAPRTSTSGGGRVSDGAGAPRRPAVGLDLGWWGRTIQAWRPCA
mgnify:CR=1 FL=1